MTPGAQSKGDFDEQIVGPSDSKERQVTSLNATSTVDFDTNYPSDSLIQEWRKQILSGTSTATGPSSLVGVGASTGGPTVVFDILETIALGNSAMLITQHMPKRYLVQFTRRLNEKTPVDTCIAEHGMPIDPGKCYVAPGSSHLTVAIRQGRACCVLQDSQPVNGHIPSVDVLFHSLARLRQIASIGVLLTGMGKDGAAGLRAIRQSGGLTLAQDRRSSAVWGMPGSAVAQDAVEALLAREHISPVLSSIL